MRVSATTTDPPQTAADTVVVGVFEGKDVSHDVSDGALQRLLDTGEAKRSFKSLAVTHADGKRWVLVGLGERDRFDAERARVASATALARAAEASSTKTVCWEVPHHVDAGVVAGLVEGAVLGRYRFTQFKSKDDGDADGVEELILSAHDDVAAVVDRAATISRFVNLCRDLQNTPANHMTPTILAEQARRLEGVVVSVEGREEIVGRGMGAFAAVAQGTYEEPALITITYRGSGASGDPFPLGLVGKAVTFDSGGISIKPGAKMQEMKFDMSGGAAVIAAMGAIAALELPIDVVAVVGATENLPSGRSVKPGDVVTAMTGTTIEVNNTDAEGRLVLSDCLAHAISLGAERVIDLATLTGAIIIALGSTYSGLVSNDDEWAQTVEQAGSTAGDIVWRLPLHEEYDELIKGRYGDISNVVESRKAGSITAAQFLKRFVGDTPWAHLDIAGTAWDTGKAYAAKGGNGVGVRLLVELASKLATAR